MPDTERPDIELLRANGDVRALIDALRHRDPGVPREAAKALGELGDAQAVEPLSRVVPDSVSFPPETRIAAIGALASIGASGAVAPLAEALKSDNIYVSTAAERAIDKIGGADAAVILGEHRRGRKAVAIDVDETRYRMARWCGIGGGILAVLAAIVLFQASLSRDVAMIGSVISPAAQASLQSLMIRDSLVILGVATLGFVAAALLRELPAASVIVYAVGGLVGLIGAAGGPSYMPGLSGLLLWAVFVGYMIGAMNALLFRLQRLGQLKR